MSKALINRSKNHHVHYTVCDSLMRYAKILGFGDMHIKLDKATGLVAIISVHNLTRGPAIGGCRLLPYDTVDRAMEDSMRLAYMMSFKAAINNLNHGGGKAVLIKPKVIKDPQAYFEKFGEFVNELGGRYITAVDSGTSPHEMDIIARRTSFVTCTTKQGGDSDPSPLTALGVRRAIEAAIQFKQGKDSLEGVHVAIQGLGHVGMSLAEDLHQRGARLTVADISHTNLERCVAKFNAKICSPTDIYDVKADVFSPCALGAVINRNTIKRLNVSIVAGSANNQLAHNQYGTLLHERGILYAPDFLINAGGLIHVAVIYDKGDLHRSLKQINGIYQIVYDLYERSASEGRATNLIAEEIARQRLTAHTHGNG